MSEEALNQEVEEVQEEEVQEYNDVEKEAITHGWNPAGVEGKRNLTAEEFMDRQPLYDDIKYLKKEVRRLNDAKEALKATTKIIREKTKEQVINELKNQKRAALEAEDFDAVIEIDDKIAEENANTTDVQEATNEAFYEWVDRNEWYNQDPEMKEYADMIGTAYYQRNPSKPYNEIYDYVEKQVKKHYKEKFDEATPTRKTAAPVEGAQRGRARAGGKRHSARDLDEQTRSIMKNTVRSGAMSEQEWLDAYFSD